MRDLYILQGLPGSGKSTFIKNNGIEHYTICPDDLRILYAGFETKPNGLKTISQKQDNKVWRELFNILQLKMEQTETIFIDATHTRMDYINRYLKLCKEHRYSLHIIDFSDVSVEVCKERNKLREEYKQVPDEVIDRMNEQLQHFKTLKLLKEVDVIHHEVFSLVYEPMICEYNNVVVFGDIHGCYDKLNQYFIDKPINESTLYVFCGDYLDRGMYNAETMRFLLSVMNKDNFIFVEGNHERWIRMFSKNDSLEGIKSKDFIEKTSKDLETFDKKELRRFCSKLIPFLVLMKGNKKILITHGGMTDFPNKLTRESECIKGTGKYENTIEVDKTFYSNHPNCYSIHGHRNIEELPIFSNNGHTMNLEGKIEFGGDLRVVEI